MIVDSGHNAKPPCRVSQHVGWARSLEKVNGKEATALNSRVPVGENSIEVSLVFNPSWGEGMARTAGRIYTKTMTLQVEKGKTHFLGAKADTAASAAAQSDGSFREPIVVEAKGH